MKNISFGVMTFVIAILPSVAFALAMMLSPATKCQWWETALLGIAGFAMLGMMLLMLSAVVLVQLSVGYLYARLGWFSVSVWKNTIRLLWVLSTAHVLAAIFLLFISTFRPPWGELLMLFSPLSLFVSMACAFLQFKLIFVRMDDGRVERCRKIGMWLVALFFSLLILWGSYPYLEELLPYCYP